MLCEKRFERQNEKRCEVGDINSINGSVWYINIKV